MNVNYKEKDMSWLHVNHVFLKPGLYLVATPIGNLRDITLRALDILRTVSVVYCEDKRVSRKLMAAYGLKVDFHIYNDHSDSGQREEICARIEAGEAVALISDAGMPLISDPGYKLVRELHARGLMVTSAPGANAPLAALQLSGLPSDTFSFLGFLPSKTKARTECLERWRGVDTTLVMFESAPRLVACLHDILAVFGDRDMRVVREMTKMYEEVRRGNISELVAYYQDYGRPKGEIVLVVEPTSFNGFRDVDIEKKLHQAMEKMSLKDAAHFVAEATGSSRKMVYDMALRLK